MSRFVGEVLKETISVNLASFERVDLGREDLRPAAVALPVVLHDAGESSLILTRRSPRLSTHAGQRAFPGGRVEADEAPTETALREMAEEIGLAVDASAVLGLLDDYPTRSGFLITPVVVWCGRDPQLTLDPREVASVQYIPLAELDRPDVPRLVPGAEAGRFEIEVPVGSDSIHAPTAAILFQFREVALHGRSTRVSEYDQPRFAWS